MFYKIILSVQIIQADYSISFYLYPGSLVKDSVLCLS